MALTRVFSLNKSLTGLGLRETEKEVEVDVLKIPWKSFVFFLSTRHYGIDGNRWRHDI